MLTSTLASSTQELNLHNRYGRLDLAEVSGVWRSICMCQGLQKLSVFNSGQQDASTPLYEGQARVALNGLSTLTNVSMKCICMTGPNDGWGSVVLEGRCVLINLRCSFITAVLITALSVESARPAAGVGGCWWLAPLSTRVVLQWW